MSNTPSATQFNLEKKAKVPLRGNRAEPPQPNDGGSSPDGNATASPLDSDKAVLDEFERLERDNILEDDEDEVVDEDEPGIIEVAAKPPKYTPFRVNPETKFDLLGVVHSNKNGMEKTIIAVTKDFAPQIEAYDVELRRVRFYEVVTPDGVVRLIYGFVPERGIRTPNAWLVSKRDAMEFAESNWTIMSSLQKQGKVGYRKSRRDLGEPKFSGYSRGQLIHYGLRKSGLLAEDETHPFYRKIAELDDDE
jgi:hypothetical protein